MHSQSRSLNCSEASVVIGKKASYVLIISLINKQL